MTPELHQRATAILDEILELPEPQQQGAWQSHPEADPEVRAEVDSLLAAHAEAAGYLERNVLMPRKPEAGSKIGSWRLVEEIGQGGMSFVFRGERESGYEQRAAIKIIALPAMLTGAMARQIQARFEAERQIVARLEHPNICKLLDGGITGDGLPYLVLEYIEGRDLLTHCASLPLDGALKLFRDVAQAVHYAHQRLVVHRDLKPSNILVSSTGHPKLLDFGIAKSLDPSGLNSTDEKTATIFRAATPAYASPEQLRGEALTTATDVYSLGVLLDKLLPANAAPDLRAIQAKATREESKDRYASAADLANDIDRYLQGLPVDARQGNFQYVFAKLVRRHRAAFAAAAFAVTILIATAALTLYKNRQITRERERATAVATFLRSLFQASDPEVNQGNRLTTREVLDQGAQSIQSAALDAETKLELTETIADAYAGLGLYDNAIRLHGSIVAASAAPSRRLAHSLAALAGAQAQLGKHAPAEANARLAVQTARAIAPADPAAVAEALERHCLALYQAAKYAPATPLCAEAAETAKAAGLALLDQARYLRSLGRAQKNTGDFAGAEKSLLRSLELARNATKGQNPTAAVSLDELGGLYFRQGKFAEATRYFEEALRSERALYPEGHVTIARTLNNLANTQATLRRYEEAEKTYKLAHEQYRKFLGENSGELATSLSNMAITQQGTGRLAEAAATLEEVKGVHERNTGRDKLPYWSTILKIANLRLEQDRPAEALQTAAEAVAALEKIQPLPRIERGFARVVQATALIESGRAREALPHVEAAQEILKSTLAPSHWMCAYANAAHAGALAAHGRKDEAKRLLEPLYLEIAKSPAATSWRAEWMKRLWRRNGF
jgi:eukaryotic-like serine/threonine-protein kinase